MLRHIRAILLLPFMVVVVIPAVLRAFWPWRDTRWTEATPPVLALRFGGALLFLAGLGLFSWCVVLFARVGKGTLAPWDRTRRLVAEGPYRHLRNPMISAVVAMLLGQALFWGSAVLAAWATLFLLVNHVYFVFVEEAELERRFGDEYRRYRRRVPRWLPRARPWSREDP